MRVKPYTQTEETLDRPDDEVAREAWYRYRLRDDSIIVDLFQGQYKSKLVCPDCGKVRPGAGLRREGGGEMTRTGSWHAIRCQLLYSVLYAYRVACDCGP